MLLSYAQCIDRYGTDYKIKKEIKKGTLFMAEKGLYSTEQRTSELEIVMQRYPRAVFTDRSAFYYHSLTDIIPEYYYLATRREDTRITDHKVKQSYSKKEIFEAGIEVIEHNGQNIRIYNVERMLVELMRFKYRYSLDFYKEIIMNYRQKTEEMDFFLVEEYANMFRNKESIMVHIQMEVL